MTIRARVRGLVPALCALSATAMFSTSAKADIQCDLGVAPSNPANAVLFLLDRSGSMVGNTTCAGATPDPDDPRKWKCAVDQANQFAEDNDPSASNVYFVWQFRTMSGTEITERFNGADGEGMCRADALALLDVDTTDFEGPVVDDAATPLAGSYCDAVDFLQTYREDVLANPNLPLWINLQSDGLENRTPTDHACFGEDSGSGTMFTPQVPVMPVVFTPDQPPDATHVDGLLLGSWQAQMYDAMITGTAHEFPFGGMPGAVDPAAYVVPGLSGTVITVVNFIEEFIPTSLSSALFSVSGADQESELQALMAATQTASAVAASVPSTTEDFVNFLNGMALSSGARMTRMGSGIPNPPDSPNVFHVQPGDVDDSGCVDLDDFDALEGVFGQNVSQSNPLTFAADLSGDGRVNAADYFILAEHFGEGCTTDPGPAPVMGQALLGFEEPTYWSSQVSLDLNGSFRSEGLFSLDVGGSGWREIVSIPFSSSVFPTLGTKIAYDILVPEDQSNQWWSGQTLLFVSAPSRSIDNAFIGAVELTDKPLGEFSSAIFNIPSYLQPVFNGSTPDISLRIVVNANDPGYLLDNLRLLP